MSTLKKITSGLGWGSASVIIITVFQFVFMAVMARLLNPADFGLVAIANVSLRFFSYFAQMGIAPALIQKPILEDGDVRAALALSLGISSLFFLIAVGAAGLIEKFYEMAGLGKVIQILAINFIVLGISSVSLGLMRRKGVFKSLAVIEIISYVFGYGLVGLTAAQYGAGVWALVAAFMTQAIVTAVLSYMVVRHPISFRHTRKQRSHFLSYGGRYSIIGFIEFLTANIDALVIGKFLGVTSAGYYNRALLLANMPVQQPANILTRVLFPIMSSMGNQHEKQAISLQLSTLLVGSYAFAVGAGIYIAAPNIVNVLLGNKWLEAIPILKLLAWSVGPIYISHVASISLDSMAKLGIKLRIQLTTLVLMITLILLVIPSRSLINIAMALVVTEWTRLLIMSYVMIKLLKIPIKDVTRIVISIACITISTLLSIMLISKIIPGNIPIIFHLIFDILAGVFGLAVGFLLSLRMISRLPAILFLESRFPGFTKMFNR